MQDCRALLWASISLGSCFAEKRIAIFSTICDADLRKVCFFKFFLAGCLYCEICHMLDILEKFS